MGIAWCTGRAAPQNAGSPRWAGPGPAISCQRETAAPAAAKRSRPLPTRAELQQDLDFPGVVLGHGRAGTAAARPTGGLGGHGGRGLCERERAPAAARLWPLSCRHFVRGGGLRSDRFSFLGRGSVTGALGALRGGMTSAPPGRLVHGWERAIAVRLGRCPWRWRPSLGASYRVGWGERSGLRRGLGFRREVSK